MILNLIVAMFFPHEAILKHSFQSIHAKSIEVLVEKPSTMAPHPDVGGCVGFRLCKGFKTFWGYYCREQKSNLIYLQCLGATATAAAFCSSWVFFDQISLSICLHRPHIWLGQARLGPGSSTTPLRGTGSNLCVCVYFIALDFFSLITTAKLFFIL